MRKPFEGLFGNSHELRMLEYLLPLDIEFSINELAKEVGIPIIIADRIVKKYVNWGVLKLKIIEDKKYYSLNSESPVVKNIEQLNNILIENIIGEEKLYEIYDFLKMHDKRN